MEFHVSRAARDRYDLDESLFSVSGNVIFANFHAARLFAQQMNDRRDLARHPEQAVQAGQINAMGLIDEILHYVVGLYRRQVNPQVMGRALDGLYGTLGRQEVDTALYQFANQFPPLAVYRHETVLAAYLEDKTGGVPNRQIVLEEMLMLWLANMNPATSPFIELFDDTALEKETAYAEIISNLYDFFDTQPSFGPKGQNLIDMLRSPAQSAPASLSAQLTFIREHWDVLLGTHLVRLLSSLDFIKEEEKAIFLGPGPALVPEFGEPEYDEPEGFSPDRDWMPQLVLMAKSTYVWLGQLSEKYERSITGLDHIPNEELDTLARRGFTGLWLIGLWERSSASKRIKELCGKSDVVASAYSLYDYQIAADLGGEAALQDLKTRAWQRGIRLSSDMVPNHVGIYSRWMVEHPDWFISLDHSPFPSYHFDGLDLSQDERVGIYLEDHYYDHSDAAVVFKRVDQWTGSEKYIYHGNDGTSMPWNDTAQLNYLDPEVREAVIQTILHVARQFPVIRFDAAMTLTKRHYQRLWFPQAGTGGDIPTRADHGLTRAQFDAAMPYEFWREVVDRVAEEVPDTLLLAEAFWLMEGYFVRTLGMHRVYNSAFMNMLRDEENDKYRTVMKNTLEFDPEVLKRYVNFMNNPDERTSVDQFGKGDKYFGVCTVMSTLPGLPMFGHGQIEGFTERYGMEFRHAYWDEQPDEDLVERHEREIASLLHRRHLFADVKHFLLYDFFSPEGYVNEDVFAYSNRAGDERSLVVYHNKFATARGWVRTSAAYSAKDGPNEDRRLVQKNLGEGLGMHNDQEYFCIFRDHVTGLEYIRNSREIFDRGLYIELNAYKYHVFLDFREILDNAQGHYGALTAHLDGRGVPSVEVALREMILRPILDPYRELVNAETFRRLIDARVTGPHGQLDSELMDEVAQDVEYLLQAIKVHVGSEEDETAIASETRHKLEAVLQLPILKSRFPRPRSAKYTEAVKYLQAGLDDDQATWGSLLSWTFTHALGQIADESNATGQSRAWIDEWLLGKTITGTLQDLGLDEGAALHALLAVECLTGQQHWCDKLALQPHDGLESWLKDSDVQQFIQVNRFDDVLWFNKESFQELLWWMMALAAVESTADPALSSTATVRHLVACHDSVMTLLKAADESGYQVEKMLEIARG